MSPETHSLMLEWLKDGDEAQKRHAAFRLSRPDATGKPEPPKLPPLPDNPTPAPGVRLGGCCN